MKGVFEVLSYPRNRAANPLPCSHILHFGVRLELAAFVLLGGVEQSLVHHFFSHQTQEEAL
jgi:hypothetical protein